ncbi:MAG: hypothetical protein EXS14_02295 [Planctomycetes bacterium]|nr:hypothetical protein [Planctomycetota bacterium]
MKHEVASVQGIASRPWRFGPFTFDAISAIELRAALAQRQELGLPVRLATASFSAAFAGRRWLQPLLTQQQLVLPEGVVLSRFVGARCLRGPRAVSLALSHARALGHKVVCVAPDAGVVTWALRLRRMHRGLQIAGAFDVGSDLRDRRGLERAADRIQACAAGLLLLRVPSPAMAALAALDHERLAAPLIVSLIETRASR